LEENPEKVELVFLKEVHKKRVMNLWFDSKRNILFSIGEDKYLRAYNVKTKEPIASNFSALNLNLTSKLVTKVSKTKLTFAIPLNEFGIAIISDRNGRIHIFDTYSVRIHSKNTLHISNLKKFKHC
jgi:hypothetical protein